MITSDLITRLCGDAGTWWVPIRDACGLYEIDTPDRESFFLAQALHESDGFQVLVENLNYSPAGLLATFRKYFTPEEAVSFAHDEERIANRAYANRNGNGDEASGDGYLYRGRGIFQLTGRGNYRRAGKALGVDLEINPELAADPLHAALTAAWFFSSNGCNELADVGDFRGTTRRINGALAGLDDRLAWLAKVRAAQG